MVDNKIMTQLLPPLLITRSNSNRATTTTTTTTTTNNVPRRQKQRHRQRLRHRVILVIITRIVLLMILVVLVIFPFIYIGSNNNSVVDSNEVAVAVASTAAIIIGINSNKTTTRTRTISSASTTSSSSIVVVNNTNTTSTNKSTIHNTQQQLRHKDNNKTEVEVDDEQEEQQDQRQNQKRKRPYFILHIGPQKTATTSIQCGLELYSKELSILDNYYFLGGGCGWDPHTERKRSKRSQRNSSSSRMPNGEISYLRRLIINYINNPTSELKNENENEKEYNALHSRLQYHLQNNHNVIVSSELFASQLNVQHNNRMIWNGLDKLLMGYRPIIVIGYRHLQDWIPSNYYQKFVGNSQHFISLPNYISNYLNDWKELQNEYYYYEQQQKQEKGHRNKLPTLNIDGINVELNTMNNDNSNGSNNNDKIDDNNNNNNNNNNIVESSGLNSQSHITLWLYQKWLYHFDSKSIRIFDMHQDGYLGRQSSSSSRGSSSSSNSNNNSNTNSNSNHDLATSFICQMIPTAYNTCQMLQQKQLQQQQQQQPIDGAISGIDNINNSNSNSNSNSNNSNSNINSNTTTHKHLELSMKKLQKKKKKKQLGSNSGDNDNEQLLLRQSTDLYPQRIMELLVKNGVIDSNYFHKMKRQKYVQQIRNILINHTIIPYKKIKSSIGVGDQNQNQNYYFDCISSQLEEQLLNTSLYFMERIYNTTTTTTTNNSDNDPNHNMIEWNTIRNKHYNLFQRNIQNGKYCDINPKRILNTNSIKSQIMKLFI